MIYSSPRNSGAEGFTIVEFMLAIAISSLIAAAIYSFYLMQKKTGDTQQDVAAMQQDLRGLMQMMKQDIRMAGYDPKRSGNFGFQNDFIFYSNGGTPDKAYTNITAIAFTSDMNDASFTGNLADKSNGTVDYAPSQRQQEQFAYRWSNSGVCANRGCVQRYFPSTGNRWENVAYDIDSIEFLYTLSNRTMTVSPAAADLDNITSVTVTILAKSRSREPGYRNTETYRFPSSLINPSARAAAPVNDNFRRQMLTFTVSCRNQR